MIWFLLIVGIPAAANAQKENSITIVPEIQYGNSTLSVRFLGQKPYAPENEKFLQTLVHVNVPYSSNLAIRLGAGFNYRQNTINMKEGSVMDVGWEQFKIFNLAGEALLFYTKHFKKDRTIYLGLGAFYNIGLGGKIKKHSLIESDTEGEVNFKTNGDMDRLNSGLVFKPGYKFGEQLCIQLFYNLGIKDIKPERNDESPLRFSSFRTNDFGISLCYFIRTE